MGLLDYALLDHGLLHAACYTRPLHHGLLVGVVVEGNADQQIHG